MKKQLSLTLLLVTAALGLLTSCGSTPKGADAHAYARVKNWRSILDLKHLESQ